jgi:hypothetical protein
LPRLNGQALVLFPEWRVPGLPVAVGDEAR